MSLEQLDPKAESYDPSTFWMEQAQQMLATYDKVIETTQLRERITYAYLHTQLRYAHAELAVFRILETHMKNNTLTSEILKESNDRLAQLRNTIKQEVEQARTQATKQQNGEANE